MNNTIPYQMQLYHSTHINPILTPIIRLCFNKMQEPYFECEYKNEWTLTVLDFWIQEYKITNIIFCGKTISELIENIDNEVSKEEFPFEVSYYYWK